MLDYILNRPQVKNSLTGKYITEITTTGWQQQVSSVWGFARLRVPFILYADSEFITTPIHPAPQDPSKFSTEEFYNHQAYVLYPDNDDRHASILGVVEQGRNIAMPNALYKALVDIYDIYYRLLVLTVKVDSWFLLGYILIRMKNVRQHPASSFFMN